MNEVPKDTEPTQPKRGARFWMILVSLCLALFASALDFTGIATALPVIVNELHGADFAWAGTSYAIAATSLLPLNGGLSEVWHEHFKNGSVLLIVLLNRSSADV